jgi:hypothetical protein
MGVRDILKWYVVNDFKYVEYFPPSSTLFKVLPYNHVL